MRRQSRVVQTAAAVMLLPLQLVWSSLTAIYMVIVSHSQGRKAFDLRWAVAQRVHADEGEVVSKQLLGGGPLNTAQLRLVAIRRGDPHLVAQQVVDGLAAEGYTRHSARDRFNEGKLTTYKPEPGLGLPDVGFTVTDAGSVVAGTDIEVPEGYTGVCFII